MLLIMKLWILLFVWIWSNSIITHASSGNIPDDVNITILNYEFNIMKGERKSLNSEYGVNIIGEIHNEKFTSDVGTFARVLSRASNELAAVGFLHRFKSILSLNCIAEKHNRLYLLTSFFQDILHRTKLNQCTEEYCNTHLYQVLYKIQRWFFLMKSINREHDLSPYCWSTLYWDVKAIDAFKSNATLNSHINEADCDRLYSYHSNVSSTIILDADTKLFTVYDMDLSSPLLHPNKSEILFPGQGRQWCKSVDMEECAKSYFNCLSSKISAIPDSKISMCYAETFSKILTRFTAELEKWPHGSRPLIRKITAVYKTFLVQPQTVVEFLRGLYEDFRYYLGGIVEVKDI